ncbi:MAG: hypothetical protein NTX32_05440 [Candidatus Firestonebacteria bacterium]|nr:hypothetical protein [Candidatus Firestonebacteria bacterium]
MIRVFNTKSFLILLFMTCLFLSPSFAEKDITPEKLILDPTFECIGVEVNYTGDDNFNAKGNIKYRAVGSEKWLNGHPLIRVSDKPMDLHGAGAKNPRFFTSIFYLEEDKEYEVEVAFKDPDGVTEQLPAAKIKTRNSKVKTGGGKNYYVDPAAKTEGDGSKAKPFKTVEAASAVVAGPGDTLYFLKGVHYIKGKIGFEQSGDEKSFFHIKGEPGAIITDADPEISGVGKLKWELYKKDEKGRPVYKLPVKNTQRVMVRKKPGDVSTGYFLWRYMKDDGCRKSQQGPHRGQSLEHLVENYNGMNDCGAFIQEQETLYVVLPKGFNDPEKADVQISHGRSNTQETNNSFLVRGHHVLVEGLTFDMTVNLRAGKGEFVHFSGISVYGNNGREGLSVGPNGLIEDSKFIFNSNHDWHHAPPSKTREGNKWDNWSKVKNGANDTGLIVLERSGVFRFNYILGFNNVIQYPGGMQNKNIEIHNNFFTQVYDDCVEPDGPAINWRVYNNMFYKFFNGISDAPVDIGPFFVVRNIFYGYIQSAFKVRNGASGQTIYYHNAVYPGKDPVIYSNGQIPKVWPVPISQQNYNGCAFAPDQDGDRWMRTRNNILIGGSTTYVLRSRDKSPKAKSKGTASSLLLDTFDFDYNSLASVSGGNIFRCGESHSIDGMPKFVNLEKGDLRLAGGGGRLKDAGEIIKGINDEVPAPYQYKGGGPDIGVYEADTELSQYGPRKNAENESLDAPQKTQNLRTKQ